MLQNFNTLLPTQPLVLADPTRPIIFPSSSSSINSTNLNLSDLDNFSSDDIRKEEIDAKQKLKELEDKIKKMEEAAKLKETKELQEKEKEFYRQAEQKAIEEEARRKEKEEAEEREKSLLQKLQDFVDGTKTKDDINYVVDAVETGVQDTEQYVEKTTFSVWDFFRAWFWRIYPLLWFVNMWLVGFPFLILSIFGFLWNTILNLFLNRFWAGGNFWLMFNTAYLVFQLVMGIPVMFEIPWFMRGWYKQIRVTVFMFSFFYNLISVWLFIEWASNMISKQYNDPSAFHLAFNLFVVYNMFLHYPIIIINLFLMLKEIVLQFFQLFPDFQYSRPEDITRITWLDLFNWFWLVIFNPFTPVFWVQIIFKAIYGWDFKDLLIWNSDDKERYFRIQPKNGGSRFI